MTKTTEELGRRLRAEAQRVPVRDDGALAARIRAALPATLPASPPAWRRPWAVAAAAAVLLLAVGLATLRMGSSSTGTAAPIAGVGVTPAAPTPGDPLQHELRALARVAAVLTASLRGTTGAVSDTASEATRFGRLTALSLPAAPRDPLRDELQALERDVAGVARALRRALPLPTPRPADAGAG